MALVLRRGVANPPGACLDDAAGAAILARMTDSFNRLAWTVGVMALAVADAPAAAQQYRLLIGWSDYAPQYRDQIDRRVTSICPAGGRLFRVFGTDVYTDDSSVCSAAVHAGVITAQTGGVVTIVIGAGLPAYQGSTRNGVTSGSYGAFRWSFSFERGGVPGQVDWTTLAVGLDQVAEPITLACPARGVPARVWGTDTYTEDSSICTAAAHAGVITPEKGGSVTIQRAGAQRSFVASERNDVTSNEWKGTPTSFSVSSPAVAPMPAAAPAVADPASGSGVAGITVSPPASGVVTTEAGRAGSFTVRLNAQPTADVTIPLMSSRTAEGMVSPTSLTFTSANWMTAQSVTVTGVDDAIVDGDQPYVVRLMPAQAPGDSRYHGVDAADVTVTNSDDDVASVVVSGTSGPATSEAGGTVTFTIVLTSAPVASVTINLSSSNPAEGTVSPAAVSFNAANWSTPQTITVRGVDDSVVDGDAKYSIVTSNAISTDPKYNGLFVSDVGVLNANDDR